jgi:hypothetical protein
MLPSSGWQPWSFEFSSVLFSSKRGLILVNNVGKSRSVLIAWLFHCFKQQYSKKLPGGNNWQTKSSGSQAVRPQAGKSPGIPCV